MYEFGISIELNDEITGAAPLWIVSTRTGEAATSSGKTDKLRRPFMMYQRSERTRRGKLKDIEGRR